MYDGVDVKGASDAMGVSFDNLVERMAETD